jgi:hypothetical protein
MSAAATDGNKNAGRVDCDEVTDGRVIARMLEMRGQGYSFHDIAAALTKQGLTTLSPERVRDILDTDLAEKRKA